MHRDGRHSLALAVLTAVFVVCAPGVANATSPLGGGTTAAVPAQWQPHRNSPYKQLALRVRDLDTLSGNWGRHLAAAADKTLTYGMAAAALLEARLNPANRAATTTNLIKARLDLEFARIDQIVSHNAVHASERLHEAEHHIRAAARLVQPALRTCLDKIRRRIAALIPTGAAGFNTPVIRERYATITAALSHVIRLP